MEEKKCLKCGRSRAEDQSFCEECLADMARYPVKPGVVVLLPQQERPARQAPRKRHAAPSPEELLPRLKKKVVALWLALILALAAAGTLGWFLLEARQELASEKPLPGQNYSSEEDKQPNETQ